MTATFWLLSCVLATAQPAKPVTTVPKGDWALTPRLARGQELVYRGTYTEQANSSRVQFVRNYRLETRIFVLDTPPRSSDLAVMTSLTDSQAPAIKPAQRAESVLRGVQLERLTLDLQGRVRTKSGGTVVVPLDSAPTLEVGAFIEVPSKGKGGKPWQVSEKGRPAMTWQVSGQENVGNTPCVKIVGVQQSPDWERPRGDRSAWRRQDTVWLGRRTGIAHRVERIIEQKEPARIKATQSSKVRYELQSNLRFPGQLADDQRQDILFILQTRKQATALYPQGKKADRQLALLVRKITSHASSTPRTPYRAALAELKNQIEAVRRGETVTAGYQETVGYDGAARVGDAAPDFFASGITFAGSTRLSRWKGKPIVMVFYHPDSSMAGDVLRYAQRVHANLGRHVHVLGLSVSDDGKKALKQRDELKLGFHLMHGAGTRISYGVEGAPHFVVIDRAGIIRGQYAGWGRETAEEVDGELKRWLK